MFFPPPNPPHPQPAQARLITTKIKTFKKISHTKFPFVLLVIATHTVKTKTCFCFTLFVEFLVLKHKGLFLFYKLSPYMQFIRKHLVLALTVLFFGPDDILQLMSTGSTIKKVQHSAQHIAFACHADDANCSSVKGETRFRG